MLRPREGGLSSKQYQIQQPRERVTLILVCLLSRRSIDQPLDHLYSCMQERFPFLRARCERVGGAGSSCLFSALELTNNNISVSDKDAAVFIILCLAYKAFFESIETMVASKHHHSYMRVGRRL